MGLLQDIAASIGNKDLQRLSDGNANFDDSNSPDLSRFQDMIKHSIRRSYSKSSPPRPPRPIRKSIPTM